MLPGQDSDPGLTAPKAGVLPLHHQGSAPRSVAAGRVVPSARFERATSASVVRRSIQLSYEGELGGTVGR